jgi:hypothetical protein
MSDADTAQLIAGGAMVLLIAGLALAHRTDDVAVDDQTFTLVDGTTGDVKAGMVVPKGAATTGSTKPQRRSWLGAILAGRDNRTSTSKTVAFAWTMALAFELLALIIAFRLGDRAPWDLQNQRGLQEEYLILLGGPFAAAILAKYATTGQSDSKTDAAVGSANASQLVNDDAGNTDLGDFQYVLFNVIGLAFFFATVIGHLARGFPHLPPILTGLMLTSVGGYGAKKLLAQAAPTLSSVIPPAAYAGDTIQIFGTNLLVPASASDAGAAEKATVHVGPLEATVTAHDLVLGNDRLTVEVPQKSKPGSAPISVARADGVAAGGPAGANLLPFQVLEPSPDDKDKKDKDAAETTVAKGNGDKTLPGATAQP